MGESESNTPPRSPSVEDLELNEEDIIEVIDLDDDSRLTNSEGEDDVSMDTEDEDSSDFTVDHDDAAFIFKGHTNDVLSCAFHPKNSNLVVTGGMDDRAFIWDVSSGEPVVKKECTTKDSVDFIQFSSDGHYLAVIDLAGNGFIYKEDLSLAWEFSLFQEFKFASWHPSAPVLVGGTELMVTIYNIPTQASKVIYSGIDGTIACGQILPDGKRFAVATEHGTVRVIDMKSVETCCSLVLKIPGSEDSSRVYCMDVNNESTIILFGCHNGEIWSVNPDNGKAVLLPKKENEWESVEVVKFCKIDKHKNLAASGHLDGILRVWDHRQVLRFEVNTSSAIVDLKWHPKFPWIFTCQRSRQALLIDALTGTSLRSFQGHSQIFLSLDIDSEGKRLLTTSSDETARMYWTEIVNERRDDSHETL